MAKRSSPAHPPKSAAEKVRNIVARTCGRKAVSDAQYLARDLHIGIAEKIELLVAIEVAFGIDFTASEAERIATVRDLTLAVTRKIWSVKSPPSDQPSLSEAVRNLAFGAAHIGQAIDLTVAAAAIDKDFPHSGLTIDEICDEIERAAMEAGAEVLPRHGQQRA